MALIKRMKEGDKSPTLYSWYGKQYDFDQLQKDADEGVHEYIATLKRGSKDIDQFMKAYSDIMTGIRDGSITFKDGKYVDARGRYSNGLYYDDKDVKQTSKRSSKDYYGLMANYIYGKQRSQNEYTAPEDNTKTKIKWAGNSSIGQAITRNIFNSDTWNNQDFQDLNEYDESGKVKGTDNRHKKLYDSFNYVLGNFDNLFSEYTEQQKSDATKYIQEAMEHLKDGKIDPGDYLALSRAAGGLDYRNMFADKTVESKIPENQPQINKPNFISWVSNKYPIFKGTFHTSRSLNDTDDRRYDSGTLTRLANAVNLLNESDLYRIIRSAISDKNYIFNNEKVVRDTFKDADYQFRNRVGVRLALQALKSKGLLKQFGQNSNLYYIPNTDNKERFTAWVWDEANGTISEMSYHDIPYWREKIMAEWQNYLSNSSGDDSYWTSRYGKFKKGGIIKAQSGDSTNDWYEGLGDFDPAGYTHQYDTSRLVNADMSDDNFDPWVSNVAGKGVGRYLPTKGNDRRYTEKIEKTPYYQQFGESLLDKNGNFTEVGQAWAKEVDKHLPSNSPASFYDAGNRTRTSWTVNNNDAYNRKPNTFDKLAEYVKYVRNDQILGARHNVFLNTGKRYFYKDKNGTKHWVDPNVIDKYAVSENPVSSEWNNDRTVYWNDYELTGLKAPDTTTVKQVTPQTRSISPDETTIEQDKITPQTDGSSIIPTIPSLPKKSNYSFGNFMTQIAPDLMSAGRLFGSIRSNNKIFDIVRKSINPVLRDTYELYSPVTGAFSEMQLRNRQAADVRRQAARPFTSDASLQLAGSLEANRQATNLEQQGFLADDAEIKRTKAEALKRQEDNVARRSEVANFNRASINQTNRELAQLEGVRLKQNWQSVDNFLAGLEGRVRQRVEADRARRTNFRLQTAQQDIDDQYYEALQRAQDAALKWQKDPANASKTLSEMPNYFQFLRELSRWRNANYLGAHANVYGYRYGNNYLNMGARDIGSKYGFYKNGGSLRPSTLHMINKILKNENNT